MMGFSKNGSLLALLWASSTLATPLLVESLFGRQTSDCPDSYTSRNGLNFSITCDRNNPFNDAWPVFKVDTLNECMERCSRFWGDGEGCYGVVYTPTTNCWLRNSTTSRLSNNRTVFATTPLEEEGVYSALVDRNQMKGYDTDCPAPDKSRHSLEGAPGVEYTVECNKDIGGDYDTRWEGYPSYHDNPVQAFYHAHSLEHCLSFCIKEHPLCQGVVYNPGLEIGYANCWPKTGFPNTLSTTGSNLVIAHSATLTTIETPDSECDKNETYTPSVDDSKNFNIHCGQTNRGTNMTQVHAQNFTSCMDSCAQNEDGCVGVVFDTSLRQGFENCYLQNTSSIFSDVGSSLYGVLSAARPSESGSNGDGNGNGNGGGDSGSESKAWIAGAVVGPIVGLALIGAAIWFFRRRKASGAAAGGNVHEADAATKHNPYTPSSPAPAYAPVPQYSPPRHAPSELGGEDHQMNEMEGGTAAKYAYKGGAGAPPPTQQVHELQ